MIAFFSVERLSDFIVAISDINPPPGNVNDLDGYTRCGQFSGFPDPKGTVYCPADMEGRLVYVYLPETNYLALCEVEVYGTRKGF